MMKALLAIANVLLAAVCSIVANGEEVGMLQNDIHHKEGKEDLSVVQLLPVREHGREREGGVTSSGDNFNELLRVAFLSNPQDLTTPEKEGKGRKRKKGKGRKRDPCQRKFKDFCFHGKCKYIKALKAPSCICQEGYHGERCHALMLPVEQSFHSYDYTTILAVTAVVLSSLCLIIIAVLLILSCHKQGAYNVENEEKVTLGFPVSH